MRILLLYLHNLLASRKYDLFRLSIQSLRMQPAKLKAALHEAAVFPVAPQVVAALKTETT
jgi:hypothetical protein